MIGVLVTLCICSVIQDSHVHYINSYTSLLPCLSVFGYIAGVLFPASPICGHDRFAQEGEKGN